MPELPEVEVLRRSLAPHLEGERIEGLRVREPRLRERLDVRVLRRRLAGRRIVALGRRAKYLLFELEGGGLLAVHLGMSGRLLLVDPARPLERHDHVVVSLGSGRELRFHDPRRFGRLLALAAADLTRHPAFARLGPEPLNGLDSAALRRAAAGRRGPVKGLLMDSRAVAGLGNIYASEALFRAGIDPRRSVRRIAERRWERLATSIVETLERAIAEGGTTLNDFADGLGSPGYFRVSLAVYGREDEPCTGCGRPVRRIVQAGRSTFFCPACQR